MSEFYKEHLKSSKDLETPYEAVRAGFVALALEKNRRATPFVAMARALKAAASKAAIANDLLRISEIQRALLTAAGVSDKAIEAKMASEIWSLLESGALENAANLTDENQIASITRWLCTL